jgi:hypothetical protein
MGHDRHALSLEPLDPGIRELDGVRMPLREFRVDVVRLANIEFDRPAVYLYVTITIVFVQIDLGHANCL